MDIYEPILAGILGRVKKWPVLVVHLLNAVSLNMFLLLSTELVLKYVFECSFCQPNTQLIASVLLAVSLLFFIVYTVVVRKLIQDVVRIPNSELDKLFRDPASLIKLLAKKSVYDYLRLKECSGCVLPKVLHIPIIYYSMICSALGLTEVIAYRLTGCCLSLFMIRETRFVFGAPIAPLVTLIAALIVAQFIEPWPRVERSEEADSTQTRAMKEVLVLLDNFVTPKQLVKGGGLAALLNILYKFLMVSLTPLPPPGLGRILSMDAFVVPYRRSRGGGRNAPRDSTLEVIEEMLGPNPSADYRLEPLNKRCARIPFTELPSLRHACGYKVYVRGEDKWRPVGYALITAFGRRRLVSQDCANKFMNVLKTLARRSGKCVSEIQEAVKQCSREEGYILVVLFGSHEVLGFKYEFL